MLFMPLYNRKKLIHNILVILCSVSLQFGTSLHTTGHMFCFCSNWKYLQRAKTLNVNVWNAPTVLKPSSHRKYYIHRIICGCALPSADVSTSLGMNTYHSESPKAKTGHVTHANVDSILCSQAGKQQSTVSWVQGMPKIHDTTWMIYNWLKNAGGGCRRSFRHGSLCSRESIPNQFLLSFTAGMFRSLSAKLSHSIPLTGDNMQGPHWTVLLDDVFSLK